MSDDLRTLAQAVVTLRGEIDALALEANGLTGDDYKAATKRWWGMVRRLQRMNDDLRGNGLARAILAAITEAEERGYARAMGEVVERCESTVRDYVDGRRWDTRIMGMCDEAENIAEWASEQAGD